MNYISSLMKFKGWWKRATFFFVVPKMKIFSDPWFWENKVYINDDDKNEKIMDVSKKKSAHLAWISNDVFFLDSWIMTPFLWCEIFAIDLLKHNPLSRFMCDSYPLLNSLKYNNSISRYNHHLLQYILPHSGGLRTVNNIECFHPLSHLLDEVIKCDLSNVSKFLNNKRQPRKLTFFYLLFSYHIF